MPGKFGCGYYAALWGSLSGCAGLAAPHTPVAGTHCFVGQPLRRGGPLGPPLGGPR
jgi:hypothetical protein